MHFSPIHLLKPRHPLNQMDSGSRGPSCSASNPAITPGTRAEATVQLVEAQLVQLPSLLGWNELQLS